MFGLSGDVTADKVQDSYRCTQQQTHQTLGLFSAIARSDFECSGATDHQDRPPTDVSPPLGRSPAITRSNFERSGESDHHACPRTKVVPPLVALW